MQREAAEREQRKRERDEARKAKFVSPLTRTCPTCSAAPGDGCRVVKKGDSFAGGRPARVTDRPRQPHPERARAPAEAAA